MPTVKYNLPPGTVSDPVTAEDGSIWINHFSGLFRLYKNESTVIIQYDNHKFTWISSKPLDRYREYAASLPSPVSFWNQIYICCWDCEQNSACILCFSSDGTMLRQIPIENNCSHLFSNVHGVFALCGNLLKEIENGANPKSITLQPGEIIGFTMARDCFFFVIRENQQVWLLQISKNLQIISNYLLADGSYEFFVSCNYPTLASNSHNFFVFFRVIEIPFIITGSGDCGKRPEHSWKVSRQAFLLPVL